MEFDSGLWDTTEIKTKVLTVTQADDGKIRWKKLGNPPFNVPLTVKQNNINYIEY